MAEKMTQEEMQRAIRRLRNCVLRLRYELGVKAASTFDVTPTLDWAKQILAETSPKK